MVDTLRNNHSHQIFSKDARQMLDERKWKDSKINIGQVDRNLFKPLISLRSLSNVRKKVKNVYFC